MRCTACSRPLKPVVAIDIDGTLGDYHTHFTLFCRDYWNLNLVLDDYTHYPGHVPFNEWLGVTKEEYRQAKLAYRQGGLKRWMPVFDGAYELVRDIRNQFSEVWIASTRPYNRLDNIDPDTQWWLFRNGIQVDGLLYGDDKYQQLCNTVDKGRIVACVEDLGEQFDIAKDLGLPVIQVERTHNSAEGEKRVPRGSLDLVEHWVLDRIDKWQQQNEPIGAI